MSSGTGWLGALAVYRQPRIAAMLFLGFSAGLPFLLVFATLTAWLTQAGISRGTIGLLSWVGITYSITFFWAPVVDRLPLPFLTRALGRRRSWMLIAQVGLAAGLAGIAFSDPAQNLAQVVWCALGVAFAAATQDIAIDAWRIEAAPVEDQGAMAAAYQLGYRIALIIAGAGALWLASEQGWQTTYLVMAALVGVGVITTLIVHEPTATLSAETMERERKLAEGVAHAGHLPPVLSRIAAWFSSAVVAPFVDFFARNGLAFGVAILAFIGLFRVTDITMGVMANPFYLDLGYTLKEVAAIAKGYGVVMSIIGAILGGLAVVRFGAVRSLVLGGVLVIISNLGFAILALTGEPSLLGLALVISGDNLSAGLAGSAFIAYLSGLTNTAYTATQYALFSSLFTLPGKIIAGGSGFVVEAAGYPFFFLYTSILGIPALLLIAWLSRRTAQPASSKAEPAPATP
jgi:MFS transporter, PAT family, beta-lactamase induction signal transducer AmpG